MANSDTPIQDKVALDCWQHVASHDNTAHVVSSDILPKIIASCMVWWVRSKWLKLHRYSWAINLLSSLQSEGLQNR